MMYVRNAWYVAAWEPELEADKPYPVTILGERIVVWRSSTGAFHALEDRCVHRLAALSLGRCEGDGLRCMYHGFLYDGDGKVVEIPGQSTIPPAARVRRYAVANRHGWIWVWMGEAETADPALIPQAIGLDQADFNLAYGSIDYASEARLINDNLLDFSHLSFVHTNSFGVGSEFAQDAPRITPLPRGVRYERWLENYSLAGPTGVHIVDFHQTYDFLIPGILVMWFASFKPGTCARLDHGSPDTAEAIGFHMATSQAVTPMTDRSARYFFSTGPHRRHGDDAARDQMMAMTKMAFQEDKKTIEAQQQVIDATDKVVVMPTVHDKAVILYNRLVQKMAEAEQSALTAAPAALRA